MKQRLARMGILGGVPALLATLALGLAATPAAMAAPATCATDGVAALAPPLAAIGQEFPVGAEGGDLHAYDVLAISASGAATLSVVPLGADGNPDLGAPLESTPITLPTEYTPTTVAFAKPLRLGSGAVRRGGDAAERRGLDVLLRRHRHRRRLAPIRRQLGSLGHRVVRARPRPAAGGPDAAGRHHHAAGVPHARAARRIHLRRRRRHVHVRRRRRPGRRLHVTVRAGRPRRRAAHRWRWSRAT